MSRNVSINDELTGSAGGTIELNLGYLDDSAKGPGFIVEMGCASDGRGNFAVFLPPAEFRRFADAVTLMMRLRGEVDA